MQRVGRISQRAEVSPRPLLFLQLILTVRRHELVDTVARLHEHGLVHGDIEPRHYLIGGGLGLSRIPKIIDFDRARYINIDSAIPGEGSFKFMMEEEKLRLSALLDLPKSVWEVSAARHRKASLGRDSIVH